MRSLLIACLLATGAYVIAQFMLDHYLVAQGELDLARVARSESRLSFDFDEARDLIGSTIDGAADVRVDHGAMHARLPSGQANVRLNLRGQSLDARRFVQLDGHVEVGEAATLHLIFDEPGQLQQFTASVPLAPGWNELRLSLDQLDFKPHEAGPGQSWGGSSGLVGELRLYFSGPAGLRIALDRLRFRERAHDGGYVQSGVEWITAAQAENRLDSRQTLNPQSGLRLGVLLDLGHKRPEQNLVLRDRIRQADADAVFWPQWRTPPAGDPTLETRSLGWSPDGWLVISYALLAMIWILSRRTKASRRGDLLQLLFGMTPILALTLGLGVGEQVQEGSRLLLLFAFLFQLTAVRMSKSSIPGNPAAWKASLHMLIIASAGLLLASALTGTWQFPGWQRIAAYLPFVLLQQAMLLGFLWPRLETLLPGNSHWAAALLFGVAHSPNFALMCLSALAAFWWTRQYHRHRSWLPIILTHYVLGLLAITCLPSDWLYSAETGLRYFQVQ